MFESNMQMQMPIYTGVMMNQMVMPPEPQLRDIQVPGVNDVMCGRGGGTNNHIGNIRFRQLVNGHKLRYLAATKSEKPMVSREVVTIWRGLSPPGRFLMQEKNKSENGGGNQAGRWYDIGDKKAREKASQCLRERTPEVQPFVKKLELQQKLQQDEETGVKVEEDANGNHTQTAAELSKELLQEQQQAAITAHMALKAYIPPSIMKLSQDVNAQSLQPSPATSLASMANVNNIQIQHPMPQSIYPNQTTSMPAQPRIDVGANNSQASGSRGLSVEEQKEQLAKEIELLKQEQAKLEAEAEAAEREAAQATGRMTAEELLNEYTVGTITHGLEPIHPYDGAASTTLTKEEYRNSVRALLGTSSGQSSSGRSMSTMERNSSYDDRQNNQKVPPANERKNSFDRSEYMETMSRGSWVRSVNTFDDVSMTSNTMLSPGSSMKQMLNDLEPLDIREGLSGNMKVSDRSLGKASLSTYESQILEHLISPTNLDAMERLPSLPNIKEDESRIPTPRMPQNSRLLQHQQRQHSDHSNVTNHHSNHHNNHHQQHSAAPRSNHGFSKEMSAVSMLSDFSDYSHKSMHMQANRQRIDPIAKTKSEQMFNDNMSELSSAMGSLDMSTNKSFKE